MLSARVVTRIKPWLMAVAVVVLAACGGSDDPPPTGSTGDFTFSITPTALSLAQGQSGQVTATLTRTGGFAGAVAGTVEGVPAGVSITPLSIPAGSNSAQATVSVGATVAAGVYPITIRGNATGIAQKTLTVTLTVTAVAAPTLAIVVSPNALSVQAGAQGSATATITRGGGFAGAVTLAVTGAPAGMAVTSPAIAAGATTSAMSVDVGAAVAAGTYALTVRATGTGVTDATATLTVAVTAAPVPTVGLAIAPTAITVGLGAQGTSQATITRGGGFTGAVTLSVTGAPAGVTFLSPTIATGATTSTITVSVGAAVAPGAYPLTVRANGTGVTEASAVLTLTVVAPADYTVALAPNTLTIAPAAQGNSTINITRSGGFAGSLTFALQAAAPAGITVGLPGPVAGNSATITVAVGAQVAAGNYPLTINVTGTGVPAKAVVLTVTVSSLGSFTLSANPTAVTITQGLTTQTTVSIARVAPHVAPVTLSVTGMPNGVSAVVTPNPVAGTTATITFTATAGATVGAGSASVTGTGGGVTSPTLIVPITVQVSGGGGAGNVTFNFCTLSGIPLFFAYQDGLGAWTRATANVNNTYNFTINSPRGGIAYVLGSGASSNLEVQFGSVAELNAIGSSDCDGTPVSGRTINGSVTGIGTDDIVFIAGGGATTFAALVFPTFALEDVKPGPFDLIAAQFLEVGAGKFIIRRNLNPPNATALPVLDFAGPEAFNPLPRTVTINNGLGQNLSLFGLYVLQGSGTGLPYFFDSSESPNTVRNWFGVPTDKQAAGDFHFIFANATNGTPSTQTRQFGRVFRDAANQTFTLPAVLSSTGVSALAAAGGNSRLRAVYTPQNDYLSQWSVDYTQAGNGGVGVSISMTAAYSGGGPVTLDVPDLTPLAGWNTNWGLKPGFSTDWEFSATGASASFNVTSSALVEGAEFRSAQRVGTITP